MQKMMPCLWFDDQAEEAASFYTGIFKNSRIDTIHRFGPNTPGPEGKAMSVNFTLEGQAFMALNGGPHFHFTPAISFFVNCETQQELDELWEKLSAGGETEQCGWLKDRYGVSWQIVPRELDAMLSDPDPEKVNRVTQALLKMVKLDLDELRRAYRQEAG